MSVDQTAAFGNAQPPRRRWPLPAVLLAMVAIYFLSAFIGGVAAGVVAAVLKAIGSLPADLDFDGLVADAAMASGPYRAQHFMVVGVMFLVNAAAMALLALPLARRAVPGGWAQAFPLRRVKPWAIIGAIITLPVVMAAAFAVAYQLAGIPVPAEVGLTLADWRMWSYPLALVVVAPIAEEMLFRGLLFAALAPVLKRPKLVIGATALLWALIHVGQGWAKVVALIPVGLVLGAARYRTGSLRPGIAGHMALNAAGLAYMMWIAR